VTSRYAPDATLGVSRASIYRHPGVDKELAEVEPAASGRAERGTWSRAADRLNADPRVNSSRDVATPQVRGT
jgi:hypothetical protein